MAVTVRGESTRCRWIAPSRWPGGAAAGPARIRWWARWWCPATAWWWAPGSMRGRARRTRRWGALEEAGGRAHNGTLYCTLEPCAHTGRTGPCAPRIVEAGLRRVVIAMVDPHPRVAGAGVAYLRAHGLAGGRRRAARGGRAAQRGVPHVGHAAAAVRDREDRDKSRRADHDAGGDTNRGHRRGRGGSRAPDAGRGRCDRRRLDHGPGRRSAVDGARRAAVPSADAGRSGSPVAHAARRPHAANPGCGSRVDRHDPPRAERAAGGRGPAAGGRRDARACRERHADRGDDPARGAGGDVVAARGRRGGAPRRLDRPASSTACSATSPRWRWAATASRGWTISSRWPGWARSASSSAVPMS